MTSFHDVITIKSPKNIFILSVLIMPLFINKHVTILLKLLFAKIAIVKMSPYRLLTLTGCL